MIQGLWELLGFSDGKFFVRTVDVLHVQSWCGFQQKLSEVRDEKDVVQISLTYPVRHFASFVDQSVVPVFSS